MKNILITIGMLLASCSATKYTDSIYNPKNEEYVAEVAFNYNIPVSQVTQFQFNCRYVYTKEQKLKLFLECSKDEGDAGCEECYYKIYGVYLDAYQIYGDKPIKE
jgi:hypothetical protein